MPSVWYAIPATGALIAAALLVYALRGRRVGDHPYCRRCGYDLYGRLEAPTVCSECGTSLLSDKSIRVGYRKKRLRLTAWSLTLLLVCGGWIALLVWAGARGQTFDRYKPFWWLFAEAGKVEGTASNTALSELMNRLAHGQLTDAQCDVLIDRALERQHVSKLNSSSLALLEPWYDVIETAYAAGKVPPDKWQRYARRMFADTHGLELRRRVSRGDPLVGTITRSQNLYPRTRLVCTYEWDQTVEVWERQLGSPSPWLSTAPTFGPNWDGSWSFDLPEDLLSAALDGPQKARATLVVTMSDASGVGPPVLWKVPVQVEADWQLLAHTTPSVEIDRDVSNREAIEKALTLAITQTPPGGNDFDVQIIYRFGAQGQCPFQAFIRTSEREHGIGSGCLGRKTRFVTLPTAVLPMYRDVDVIIRPSHDMAARSMSCTTSWEGEVVFKKVPLPGR